MNFKSLSGVGEWEKGFPTKPRKCLYCLICSPALKLLANIKDLINYYYFSWSHFCKSKYT